MRLWTTPPTPPEKAPAWRTLLVRPQSLTSRPEADQDHLAAQWGAVLGVLVPGQRLAVEVDNHAQQGDEVLAALIAQIAPRTEALRDLAHAYLPWLHAQMKERHVSSLRFRLLLQGADMSALVGADLASGDVAALNEEALDLGVSGVQSLLHTMGLEHRLLGPHEDDGDALDAPISERGGYLRLADGSYAASLFLSRPPQLTNPLWLDPFVHLPFPTHMVLLYEGTDTRREVNRLQNLVGAIDVAQYERAKDYGRKNLLMDRAQAEHTETLTRMHEDSCRVLRMGLSLLVRAGSPRELAKRVAHVRMVAITKGADMAPGTRHQAPLYRAQRVASAQKGDAPPLYRTLTPSAENTLPFSIHSPGHAAGIPLGYTKHGNELVLYDPYSPEQHTSLVVVIGASGSGKTTLALKSVLWTLLKGGRATVVAKAGHYAPLAQLAGGHVCRFLDPDQPGAINPWDVYHSAADLVTFHQVLLSIPSDNYIDLAILDAGVTRTLAARARGGTIYEHDFVDTLTELASETPAWRDQAQRLAYGLGPYIHQGRYASITDRPTSVPLDSPMLVFDLGPLSGAQSAAAMTLIAAVTDRRTAFTATARKEGSGDDSTRKSILVVDEGWFILNYAGGQEWIDQLARMGRQRGLYSLFLSQGFAEILRNPVAVSFVNNASCAALYQQGEGSTPEVMERFTLSAYDMHVLNNLSAERGVYAEAYMRFRRADAAHPASAVVRVTLSPYEYFLFKSHPTEQQDRAYWLDQAGGDVWRACQMAVAASASAASVGTAP